MGDANYIKEKHRNLMYRGKNVPNMRSCILIAFKCGADLNECKQCSPTINNDQFVYPM